MPLLNWKDSWGQWHTVTHVLTHPLSSSPVSFRPNGFVTPAGCPNGRISHVAWVFTLSSQGCWEWGDFPLQHHMFWDSQHDTLPRLFLVEPHAYAWAAAQPLRALPGETWLRRSSTQPWSAQSISCPQGSSPSPAFQSVSSPGLLCDPQACLSFPCALARWVPWGRPGDSSHPTYLGEGQQSPPRSLSSS